jgi:hypothetical protein
VCGDRREVRKCAKVRTLDMVIRALEFEPVGPQNQWVDVMFLTPPESNMLNVQLEDSVCQWSLLHD